MQNKDNSSSDFGKIKASGSESINLSRATRLERSGSTCDAYIVRKEHKTLFVKKLKDELRGHVQVRVAFHKEFELGETLVHPGLPVYRSRGDDYIVMDYVDGSTLADMIADRDPWLTDSENIRGMLRRLVDVVGYMHRKNVLHSDIKPDNVMITYGTRNTMLIDLDKAYTFTHNDTAGAPGKYGLADDDHGNPAIDYNGIAGIVDRLTAAGYPTKPFRRFRRLCKSPGIRNESLAEALDCKPKPVWHYWAAGVIVLVMASIGISRWLYSPANHGSQMNDREVAKSADTVNSIIATESPAAPASVTAPEITPAKPEKAAADNSPQYVWRELPEESQISNSAKARVAATREVTRVVDVLYCHLDDLSKMRKDTTLSSDALLAAMRDFTAREERYFQGIKQTILAEQPDISADDLYILVYNSQKALDYIKQSNLVQEKVGAEFRRRYIKEHGKEPPRVIP